MDCSLPGSSVHGIFQAKVLEWVAIALSEESWSTMLLSFMSLSEMETDAETPILWPPDAKN